ncbi:unnamed protein product [Chrysoparadoxa australica]
MTMLPLLNPPGAAPCGLAPSAPCVPHDLFPAVLYGPGHSSIKAPRWGGEGAAPVPDHDQDYHKQVVNAEVDRANIDRGAAGCKGLGSRRRWQSAKSSEHGDMAYRTLTDRKKRAYQQEELAKAFQHIQQRKERQDKKKYQARWKVLFMFQEMCEGPDCRMHRGRPLTIRLTGGDKALYEQMFKGQPKKFIGRHRFLTVLRIVYGFDIAPIARAANGEVLDMLNKVYHTFDMNASDEVDWRLLLFMLNVIVDAKATCDKHLKFGFGLYSSVGSYDLDCPDPVRLQDIKDLLMTLASYGARSRVEEMFDAAWISVVQEDEKAHQLVNDASNKNLPTGSIKISLSMLNALLKQPTMVVLHRPATRFGPRWDVVHAV